MTILNEPTLNGQYRVFERNSYQNLIHQISEAGLRPWGIVDIMRKRVEAFNSRNPNEIYFWFFHDFATSDGCYFQQDGIKIVLDAEPLMNINNHSNIRDGAVILSPYLHRNLKGRYFSKKYLETARLNVLLSINQLTEDDILLTLARGDKVLLREHAKAIIELLKLKEDDKLMGIYIGNQNLWLNSLRPWTIYSIYARSSIYATRKVYSLSNLVASSQNGMPQNTGLERKILTPVMF